MIIFIYGEDSFRSRKKLKELEQKFKKDVDSGGDSIKHIDGEKCSVEVISQAYGAVSLFSKKRLIIIENIFSNQTKTVAKDLRDYLQKKEETSDDGNVIVFIDNTSGEKMGNNLLWKFLSSQKFVQKFSLMSATAVAEWLRNRATELGGHLTHAQSNHMAGVLGSDLWSIENELKKIIHYKKGLQTELVDGGITEIEDEDLKMLTHAKVEENIFALTDAISQKDKKRALRLLEAEIEAGTAEQYLLHMIIRQFRILLSVRQALDSGLSQRKMVTDLKLHPYVVQKSIKQAGAYSLALLKTIFELLIEIDKGIKTGKTDFKIALCNLIVKL